MSEKKTPTAANGSASGRTHRPTTLPRLPSLKSARDLNLGASTSKSLASLVAGGRSAKIPPGSSDPKKNKFVPNLNVQRKSKESVSDVKDRKELKQDNSQKFPKGGGRGRGGNKPELIQTSGAIFSDGMGAEDGLKRRVGFGGWGGDRESEGSRSLERPKIDLKSLDKKFDKAAEDEKLQELLRDNFIDDLMTGNATPVQLPMVDSGKVFKEEVKGEDDEDEDDIRIMMQESEGKGKSSLKKSSTLHPKTELKFCDLLERKSEDLFFIHLPDHLPIVAIPEQDQKPPNSQSTCRSQLKDLSEGYLGKIQVRASGKTQLMIGELAMDINFGTQVGFLQEIASVNVTEMGGEHFGNVVNLGRVRHRLVVSPDWNHLFDIEASPELDSDDDILASS